MIQEQFKKGNSDKIFFDKITYKEFYKAVKTKYGVGINKYFQAYNISKYSKYNDMWLYLPEGDISQYANTKDKSYTGWYYGAGNIDRVCANGIRLLLKDKIDGITGKTGFYSPFSSMTGTEIIIWDQDKVLERRPNHKYDTMQFIKHLHFNPLTINFDMKFSIKNKGFKMINYYLENKTDQTQIDNIFKIKPLDNQLKIMSLNTNNFSSVNLNDQPYYILEYLFKLLDQLNIDICFLQEYNTDLQIDSDKYLYIKSKDHYGLVILYKKNLKITDIESFQLFNESFFPQKYCISFNLNGKKFATTQLEIGKSFTDRSGSTYYADELYKIINFNFALRKKQLKQIIDKIPDPNFIIGSFNFNNLDKEFEYITKTEEYYTGLLDNTTVSGKQVDFIFSKKPYEFFTKINYQFSEHKPIIAIIDC